MEGLVVAPMQTVDNPAAIGGILVAKSRDAGAAADLLPVVKSLAAQIASAVQMAQIHAQTVAHERLERELAMAGQIQASFLPTSLPRLAGWDLAVTLEPARVASGDFYDFIPLSDDRLGIVIADVSDKGMGAALYMALARTLLRTYASEYPDQPDRVLDATNRRILGDAGAGLFVTVFYATLDPASGWLNYCNAGHPPPLLFNPEEPTQIAELGRTGMALGAVEDTSWRQRTVHLEPGQVLLLYSDGISDAQDPERQLYGRERLRSFLAARAPTQRPRGPSAQYLLDSLLVEVHGFMGSAAQFDDIALSVLVRST
jgi:serine phosphatase RsbU (regulator of sigma subunit)